MSRAAKACKSSSGSIGMRMGASAMMLTSNAKCRMHDANTKCRMHNAKCERRHESVRSCRFFCAFCMKHFALHVIPSGGASIVGRWDHCLDPAPHRKISDDRHAPRVNRPDKIVEDLVSDVFVKNAAVPEFDHVVL